MRLTLDLLHPFFRRYADVDFAAANAFLYAAICEGVVEDDELLLLADDVLPGQPPPNLLFAAVHALLLRGTDHPLRHYYPDLTPNPLPKEEAFPHFRAFALAHADEVRTLVRTRRVQTNVLERCGLLLPAFATAAARLGTTQLATIEVGASAGLNLLWHHYAYDYTAANTTSARTWGNPSSPVRIAVVLRGDYPLPNIPRDLGPVMTAGVDLEPVDLTNDDDLLWQRALIWPDRPDRQQRLTAAMTIAREAPPSIVEGDACDLLPTLIKEAPSQAGLVVFASFSLYQFPREAKDRLTEILRDAGRTRPIAFLRLDGTPGDPSHASIDMTIFDAAADPPTTRLLRGHHHGLWLEWLAPLL